ncbi:MAG: VCBS repeat-containing protein [Nannocystis sp.]|nr:VCBS repeat-containing protein [Nannocystis sp.]
MAQTGVDGTFPAVADLDLDGKPEVAVISNNGATLKHHLVIWRYNPDLPNKVEIVRPGININGPLNPSLCPVGSAGNTRGGGPPTIADFNGDGTPDVAVAGGIGYAVFDGKKLMDPNVPAAETLLWIKQTKDCSSAATGSSVFDFDGDGSAEVVYSDEHYLRIYKGSTGDVLWQTCNTTGTLRDSRWSRTSITTAAQISWRCPITIRASPVRRRNRQGCGSMATRRGSGCGPGGSGINTLITSLT